MIKTILFDMGGVIMPIDRLEAVRRFKELGLSDAEQQLDEYTQNGIFGDLEEGKITTEDFRRELSLMVGRELTNDECRYAVLGYAMPVPEQNLKKLEELRSRGYRIVLLSNTNPHMMSYVRSSEFDGHGHGIGYYLDEIYTSYECGAMKPSPVFFKNVMEKESLNSDETLFLDDGPSNISAADALGIQTLFVEKGTDWTLTIDERLAL